MASKIPAMNSIAFLRFMENPDSNARIEEEYKSIMTQQKEEVETKYCVSFLQFLCLNPRLENNSVISRASFMDGYDHKRKFLCTKHPLKEECENFWQAAWDNQVELIIMMDQLSDKKYQYWSPKEKKHLVCGKFKIKTRKIIVHQSYILTVLRLTETALKPKQRHLICHYQYTAWPKGGLPECNKFLEFYLCVENMYLQLINKTPHKKFAPILIHCFNALGRSQVYCAVDISIKQLVMTKMISLSHVLENMEEQKCGSINSLDLYVLCYKIMKTYIRQYL